MKADIFTPPYMPKIALKQLTGYLRIFKELNTKLYIPCVGQFSTVICALNAGYAIKDIYTSDIGLLPSILGYYYSGQKLSELLTIIQTKDWIKESEKAACLLLTIKIGQLGDSNIELAHKQDLILRMNEHVAVVAAQLEKRRTVLGGINYEIRDVRNLEIGDNCMVWDVPTIREKRTAIEFEEFKPFNYKTEFTGLWEMYKGKNVLGYIPKENYGSENVVSAITEKGQKSYFLSGGELFPKTVIDTTPDMKNGPFEVIHEDLILGDNKITVNTMSSLEALYYRGLFSHNMGTTKSDKYFGIFVNGKLMSVFGLHCHAVRTMREEYLFISFCMTAYHPGYIQLNRLALLIIMSGEFKKRLMGTTLKSFRYLDVQGVKMTCNKYTETPKSHKGFTLVESTLLEDGRYKLVYQDTFTDLSYSDCIEKYLREETMKHVQAKKAKRERR